MAPYKGNVPAHTSALIHAVAGVVRQRLRHGAGRAPKLPSPVTDPARRNHETVLQPAVGSVSPLIVLHEAGLKFDPVLVSLDSHQLKDGSNFYAYNAPGYVPLLELDDGRRETEGPAIVQYIADQVPDKKLAPPNGSLAHYQLQSMLNLITSELHKSMDALFGKDLHDDTRRATKERLTCRRQWQDCKLEGKQYAMGDTFSEADACMFTGTNWGSVVGVDIAAYQNISAVCARIASGPAVQVAMKAAGFLR